MNINNSLSWRKLLRTSWCLYSAVFLSLGNTASASSDFTINKMQIIGNNSIAASTIEHYLSVVMPLKLSKAAADNLLRKLYDTGLFDDIKLLYEDGVLKVIVKERPIIASITLMGNSVLASDKILTTLHNANVVVGGRYNPVVINNIVNGLRDYYDALGHVDAMVSAKLQWLGTAKAALLISINEGKITRVSKVNVVGNRSFNAKVLRKVLALRTPGVTTIFTQADRYNKAKLAMSVTNLKEFYLDHGYLQVVVSEDQPKIANHNAEITLHVDEGQQFYYASHQINAPKVLQHILTPAVVKAAIVLQPGDLCARPQIISSQQNLSNALSKYGYLFANVSVVPHFVTNSTKVELEFIVNPGPITYVRYINFMANNRTNDQTLRQEMVLAEHQLASNQLLEQSKHRLSLLPFIKNVDMSITRVPNEENFVDVNYKVDEDSSAQASVTASYSMVDRFGLGLGLNQKNFFGTGNTLGLNFNQNHYQKFYTLSYSEPYYTISGISRDINVSLSHLDPAGANLSNAYTSNDYAASVTYGIPLDNNDILRRIYLGFGYESTLLHLTAYPSAQVIDFINKHGRMFQQLHLNTGISSDSRDKAIFPNTGTIQKLFVDWFIPLSSQSLHYYQLRYDNKFYYPINYGFIVNAKLSLAYGNSFTGMADYPMFKTYYSGGFDSVHGYLGNTLGPRDSNDNPTGGNILTNASIGMILPNVISDSVRTTMFVDAGNVFYHGHNNIKFGGHSSSSGPLRYSTGIEFDWLSPLGFAIGLSYSIPVMHHHHDEVQRPQFSLGANLG